MVPLDSGSQGVHAGDVLRVGASPCSNHMHNASRSLQALVTAMITSIPLTKDRPLLEFMETVFNHYRLLLICLFSSFASADSSASLGFFLGAVTFSSPM